MGEEVSQEVQEVCFSGHKHLGEGLLAWVVNLHLVPAALYGALDARILITLDRHVLLRSRWENLAGVISQPPSSSATGLRHGLGGAGGARRGGGREHRRP